MAFTALQNVCSLLTFAVIFSVLFNSCYGFYPKHINASLATYEYDCSDVGATWYGSATDTGSDGGSYGYGGTVAESPLSSLVSATCPSLYKSGKGCGAWYETVFHSPGSQETNGHGASDVYNNQGVRTENANFHHVHAYVERKALTHSLNDTKTAVQQLHIVASAIVKVIIIVVSLLIMGVATIKVVFVVTLQLPIVGFMLQNTCKTIFESIIFVFVMHPFDVGDRCVIDGVHMIVEGMNILTTMFLRYDMEKIYYPNSVLITKSISNFRRSPDMGDAIDFTNDVSTPTEDNNALKKLIQLYIESKPNYWSLKYAMIFKEIENMDKMNLVLVVQHTMNHQDYDEKSVQRSELVFELKKIFEAPGIKYCILPQDVHLVSNQLTSIVRSNRKQGY